MKIAVLGTGWGVRAQLPALRAAGFDDLMLWSRDGARAETLAAPLGARGTGSLADALAWAELVFVSTPVYLHEAQALAALSAGCHVICEKPFALDAGEAARMADAAAARPAQFAAVDHELRLLPGRMALRERLAAGEAGEVFAVEIVDRRPSRSSPEGAWSWWSDRSRGGGAWGALGSHLLDSLRWLFGEISLESCQFATAIKQRRDGDGGMRPVTADDYAVALGRIPSGAPWSVHINLAAPGPGEDRLTVRGSRATFRVDADGRLFETPAGAQEEILRVDAADAPAGMPVNGYTIGTLALARALKRAADGRGGLGDIGLASFADALTVQELLDRGRKLASDESRD